MAVYRRRYQALSTALTDPRWRFLVFTRHAVRALLSSRLFVLYYALCFAAPIVAAVLVYLHYNPLGLEVLRTTVAQLVPINATFFMTFLGIQTSLGSVLAAIIGPILIAPDFANNALPLYLARPIRRRDYVLGKLTVLIGVLSLLTWIPMSLVFGLQAGLAGWSWFAANARIELAILLCSWLWIAVVSLVTLALSAWVRWRPIATLAVFGYFFASAAVGALINELMATDWGSLLNAVLLVTGLWAELFGVKPPPEALPPLASAVGLSVTCVVFLALLLRRVRAYEVVR